VNALKIAISEIEIARSSTRSAPETRLMLSSQCQSSRPAVAASVSAARAGAQRLVGPKTPLIRITTSPTVSAITGARPA
jgi:hypothetical protein